MSTKLIEELTSLLAEAAGHAIVFGHGPKGTLHLDKVSPQERDAAYATFP